MPLSAGFFPAILQAFSFACPRAVSSVTVTMESEGKERSGTMTDRCMGQGIGEKIYIFF